MKGADRWYERARWTYAADRHTADVYAAWVGLVPWKLFCTFTFAWKVSDQQADKTFAGFINRLERDLRADIVYVRGDEKRLSGCGKPASGRHFHVLMTSAATLIPSLVQCQWMAMAGTRSDDAGAQVNAYDPNLGGASYVLKLINQPDGDWAFNKLHLVHPLVTADQLNLRQRRNVRRHHDRMQSFAVAEQKGIYAGGMYPPGGILV